MERYEEGTSRELVDGIAAWKRKVATLMGRRVTAAGLDGTLHAGVFGFRSTCQPTVTDDSGRRWLVDAAEVDRLVAEVRP